MQDYFGYSVRFVMNVTDIDDKIILRAQKRRAEFVMSRAKKALMKEENEAVKNLVADIEKAVETNAPLKELCEKVEALRAKALDTDGSILDVGDGFSNDEEEEDGSSSFTASVDGGKDWSIQTGYLKLLQFYEKEFMEDMVVRGEKSRLFDQSERIYETNCGVHRRYHKERLCLRKQRERIF